MVAEVQLYWVIYSQCSAVHIDLISAKVALQAWQQDWMTLLS